MSKFYVQIDSSYKNILREKRTRKEHYMITGYVNKNICDFYHIMKGSCVHNAQGLHERRVASQGL